MSLSDLELRAFWAGVTHGATRGVECPARVSAADAERLASLYRGGSDPEITQKLFAALCEVQPAYDLAKGLELLESGEKEGAS